MTEGPCDGCGHPYREDEHVPGQTKCCPDCTHTASPSGSRVQSHDEAAAARMAEAKGAHRGR